MLAQYVAVEGTFFRGDRVVGTGLWNTDTAPKGAALPMDVIGDGGSADRAEIVVTSADCE